MPPGDRHVNEGLNRLAGLGLGRLDKQCRGIAEERRTARETLEQR